MVVHVVPSAFMDLHEPSAFCWCKPVVESKAGSCPIVFHQHPLGADSTHWMVVRTTTTLATA